MTLQQLKYLLEVAEKGSINKAARGLHISQPSLSNAIRDLENEVNITIFIRNSKGVILTDEGEEFLVYARQLVKQAELLEDKYTGYKPIKQKFSVSTQHYSVGILSFSELIREYGKDSYEFKIRETKIHEIIDDVRDLKSEVGIIYLNKLNENHIKKRLATNNLEFMELFVSRPKILTSGTSPLANKEFVTMEDLVDHPCISFEQDGYNLFYFSDEILSTIIHRKNIKVSERATLCTLINELDGYTISTGIISDRLRKTGIVSVDLKEENYVKVGIVIHNDRNLSHLGRKYIEILKKKSDSML